MRLETNEQKERRATEHIMELLQNSLERCGQKRQNKPKEDLFWSRIGSETGGGGFQRNVSGGGKGRQWIVVQGEESCVVGVLVALGHKFVDPQEKGLFLDVN